MAKLNGGLFLRPQNNALVTATSQFQTLPGAIVNFLGQMISPRS